MTQAERALIVVGVLCAALWVVLVLPQEARNTLIDIVTVTGVLGALVGLVFQIRKSRHDTELMTLQQLIDKYEQLRQSRRDRWATIKEKVQATPGTSHEIGDRTSSLDYLLNRVMQVGQDQLHAIEHGLIEDEIRSLNLLNEICRFSDRDGSLRTLVKALFSDEIAFYQAWFKDLNHIRERESSQRRFSVPRTDALRNYEVGDYFATR